ncbi:MAG TPA: nucleotidyltransferase domain-containing protein [Capsulimonadaceae bacterium]|jgi:hypothetical protein
MINEYAINPRADSTKTRAVIESLVAELGEKLVFVTVSGSHLYGFPSPDSDYDLRGVHVLPLTKVLGLASAAETSEKTTVRDGVEADIVTHDLRKFCLLLLKRNGYVLEQLLSPHVVLTSPEQAELIEIAKLCVTRHHAKHYLGFADTTWRQFVKGDTALIKPLLYTFRVLLTGIHLMRTGEVESNIVTLNDTAKLSYITDLVARKSGEAEHAALPLVDMSLYESEYRRLTADLEAAMAETTLPNDATGRAPLNDFLVRVRLAAG